MAAINSLSVSLTVSFTWSAQNNITGSDYQPLTQSGTISKRQAYGTSAANNASGGSDQFVSYVLSLAGGASSTVDLTALTNILQQSAGAVVRIKGWVFRLLSATDDTSIGTAASSVTIGAAASNQHLLNMGSITDKFTVYNGACQAYLDPTAAGFAIDGTHLNVKFLNNDGAVTAKVQITLILCTT